MPSSIVWFRQDLRLSDNPCLYEASQKGEIIPIYILDEVNSSSFKMGGASRWWLHNSLKKLNATLNNKLNVYQGDSKEIIIKLLQELDINAVYWNRCYEPWRIRVDSEIKAILKNMGVDCKSFNASLLWEPMNILKNDNTPYKVFTPFYQKGCMKAKSPHQPLPKPQTLNLITDPKNSIEIDDLKLLDSIPWYVSMKPYWDIGEEGARPRLNEFLEKGLRNYKEGRNYPAKEHVSRLSPYLHFGEISPHQVWFAVQDHCVKDPMSLGDAACFFSELGWREFSYYLLYHFPDLPQKNFQNKFNHFQWLTDSEALKAWKKGITGYPIVDAGMRELWQTGYMHNRVRMIVGSFLVKNLLIHWHHGEEWFWDCLVDADLANNSASWQWIAGSGADAAPYFRIFNPITQGEKFDPEGDYTRKFIPELSHLPNRYLFQPWEAPESILKDAGVELGTTYPRPIIDLAFSRKRALEAFKSLPK